MRALLCLLVAGCGSAVHTTQLNAPPVAMTARPPTAVELFSAGAPPRPHVDVALLQAEEPDFAADAVASMVDDMRGRAGAMGCHGLVLGAISPDPQLRHRKTMVGTCIVYTN